MVTSRVGDWRWAEGQWIILPVIQLARERSGKASLATKDKGGQPGLLALGIGFGVVGLIKNIAG
jgi:hypothetical protein